MKFYQMLEQCIEQGKKFECDIPCLVNHYIAHDKEDGSVCLYNKNTNVKYCEFSIDYDFINANYTEYDDTVYMDFLSAVKLSKEKNVWIKLKTDRISDAIIAQDNKFYFKSGNDAHLYVTDVFSEMWHVVEDN